ncbi:cell division protein FtsL [Enterococcus faecalis]
MAELKKMEDFHYEVPVMDEPVIAPEQEKIIQGDSLPVPPLTQKKHLRNVSLLEKLISLLLLISFIGIAVATIQVRTAIVQTSNQITDVEGTIQGQEKDIQKLQQEKSELSKADRIKDVAKKQGLKDIDGNIRKVK